MTTLLPFNSSKLERAVEAASKIDRLPVPISDLLNPETCPEHLLPWLAWDMHVDEFDTIPTVAAQREAIRISLELHRKKGTPWAIKRALEVYGYANCEIIEHRQILSDWLTAGGEVLDGSADLDGSTDLSAPGARFRFSTTSWAEYALRLNAADGPTTAAMMRRIAAICAAYAPVRSHLVAIILFAAAHFDSTVRLGRFAARGRMVLRDCRRFTVPSFDTLDGCDILGGETHVSTLDGTGLLDGSTLLIPERYTGEPLDGGQMDIKVKAARTRLPLGSMGGNFVEPPETLANHDYLDGRYTISGATLDGTGTINGGDLRYPLLSDGEDTLDGTSNLGRVAGPDCIWFRGMVRIRRGSSIIQEPL